jgi:trimeric autotransporter adhesin
LRKIDLSKIKVTGVANNSVLVYNNVSSSWVASNTILANVDWSYIGSIPYANSTANGVVQIVDSTANSSATVAASANSVKVAFDAAGANGATAYANAVTYTNSTTDTGYANAVAYANTIAATAYSNAASYADAKAANAYSNATSYADTAAATAYSNAISYSGNAALAYANAIAYAASNTYVNTTFAPLSGATFTGAVSGITTLAAGNTTITGSANVSANLSANNVRAYGDVQIDGNLTVSGNTVTINATNLAVEDNMIYLNDGSAVSNPDLGIAGNYNDGTYRHAGFFRDATDGVWKVYDQYLPEPDASAYIDTANASFRIADFQANTITLATLIVSNTTVVTNLNADKLDGQDGSYYAANSQLASYTLLTGSSALSITNTLAAGNTTITGFANVSGNINTTGTMTANVISVSNVSVTQTNLQVDAAGTATAMAIVFGG